CRLVRERGLGHDLTCLLANQSRPRLAKGKNFRLGSGLANCNRQFSPIGSSPRLHYNKTTTRIVILLWCEREDLKLHMISTSGLSNKRVERLRPSHNINI